MLRKFTRNSAVALIVLAVTISFIHPSTPRDAPATSAVTSNSMALDAKDKLSAGFRNAMARGIEANPGNNDDGHSGAMKNNKRFTFAGESGARRQELTSKTSTVARRVAGIGVFVGAFVIGTRLGGYALEKVAGMITGRTHGPR